MKKILQSSFVRNVAIMITGVAGAQAITMALSPIITRLYGPESFGLLGTFTALTRVIMPVAALTYPIAIVLPKSDKNAKKLIKLSIHITLAVSILSAVILLFFNNDIVDIFQIQVIGPYLYLIPLVIIFAGLVQVLEQWLIRTNQFSINAKTNFLQSLITNGSKTGFGFIYPTASTLIILQAIGNGIKALLMILFVRNSNYKESLKKEENIISLKKLAKKHSDFPLYRAPEVFISGITENLPVLLLTSLFGPASAGFYNIGRTVLSLPTKLIGKTIGDVFYPRISEAANNGENLDKVIKKTTFALLGLGFVPFGVVVLFGPFLFEFVFGNEWDVAGEYARWIALVSFAIFLSKPCVRAMPVLKAQRFQLIFTISVLVVQTTAMLLGFIVFNSDMVAVALFGITGALSHILLVLITLKMSKRLSKD